MYEDFHRVEPIRSLELLEFLLRELRDEDLLKYMVIKVGVNCLLYPGELIRLTLGDVLSENYKVKPYLEIIRPCRQFGMPTKNYRKDLKFFIKYYKLDECELTDPLFFGARKPDHFMLMATLDHKIKSFMRLHKVKGVFTPGSLRVTWAYHYYRRTGDIRTLTKLMGYPSQKHTFHMIGVPFKDKMIIDPDVMKRVQL